MALPQWVLIPREHRKPQNCWTKIYLSTRYTLSTWNQWNSLITLSYSQIRVIIFPPMAELLHTLMKTNNAHNSFVRYDERLILETSAFQIFQGGNLTFINSFDKTKFLSVISFISRFYIEILHCELIQKPNIVWDEGHFRLLISFLSSLWHFKHISGVNLKNWTWLNNDIFIVPPKLFNNFFVRQENKRKAALSLEK